MRGVSCVPFAASSVPGLFKRCPSVIQGTPRHPIIDFTCPKAEAGPDGLPCYSKLTCSTPETAAFSGLDCALQPEGIKARAAVKLCNL